MPPPMQPGGPPSPPMGGGAPPPAAPKGPSAPKGGGGGKQINLGVPTGGGEGPGALAFIGTAPGAGPGGPPPPGGEGGQAPEEPSSQNMDFPELHIDGLDEGSGLEDLPDEGHARIHYKVTSKGKRSERGGKDKGKAKHHATLEVHHITPEAGAGQKPSEADTIRDKAKKFFQTQDQGGTPAEEGPGSEMPG